MHSYFEYLLKFVGGLAVLTVAFHFLLGYWLKRRHARGLVDTAKILDAPERWIPPRPMIGGILFFTAVTLSYLFEILIGFFEFPPSAMMDELTRFIAASVAFGLGFWDDRKRIRPAYKLIGQFAAALIVVGGANLRLGFENEIVDFIISVIFIVAVMNSFNMLDNMDAVATIVATGVFVYHVVIMNLMVPYKMLLLASLAAFLIRNWPKSRIFMGDSGSMLVGFLIATSLMMPAPAWEIIGIEDFGEKIFNLVVAITLLALPFTDTLVVTIQRLIHGISPARGGRDHTTHNLVYAGMKEKHVAVLFSILMLIQIAIAWMLFVSRFGFTLEDSNFNESYFMNWVWVGLVYFLLLFVIMLLLSVRNLRKGKYSYAAK